MDARHPYERPNELPRGIGRGPREGVDRCVSDINGIETQPGPGSATQPNLEGVPDFDAGDTVTVNEYAVARVDPLVSASDGLLPRLREILNVT